MLPENVKAVINIGSFPVPPIFDLLAKRGGIPERDMYNTFNMGIGLVLAVPQKQGEKVLGFLRNMGESAYIIGSCNSGEKGVELVW
jgi:phosphoribosylformylglycinamidine cyclo-ligase